MNSCDVPWRMPRCHVSLPRALPAGGVKAQLSANHPWGSPGVPQPSPCLLPGIKPHVRTRARPRRVCQSPSSRARSALEIIVPKHFDEALSLPSLLASQLCWENAGCRCGTGSPACSARRRLVQINFASNAPSRFLLTPTTSGLLSACVACPPLRLWDRYNENHSGLKNRSLGDRVSLLLARNPAGKPKAAEWRKLVLGTRWQWGTGLGAGLREALWLGQGDPLQSCARPELFFAANRERGPDVPVGEARGQVTA